MSQHQAASGQFDRAVNSADGVGSLKHGSRTDPVHGEGAWGITVLTGTAKMEIPVERVLLLPVQSPGVDQKKPPVGIRVAVVYPAVMWDVPCGKALLRLIEDFGGAPCANNP